jgi:tRNA (guanine37-N1)-methyltransferase
MRIDICTLFPECFDYLNHSILGEARKKNILKIHIHNIRDFSSSKHKQVDDYPFGGGAGMLLTLEPVLKTIEHIETISDLKNPYKVLFTPKGNLLNQKKIEKLKEKKWLILICPRYEGIDERILNFIDEEISVGDFILSGGELPALILIEALAREIPNVLGNKESLKEETFQNFLLEPPQFTRPENYNGLKVPKILLSGNKKKIEKWRKAMSIKLTFLKRKDLIYKADLDEEGKKILKALEEKYGK